MRVPTLPDTSTRVQRSTSPDLNQKIQEQTNASIMRLESMPKEVLDKRIQELDAEWDVERVLQVNAPVVAGLGLALGVGKDRRFLLLPAIVFSFFLQHSLQGWCPPIPVFRKLGVRTQGEIDREKYALKALRGDFDALERFHSGDASLRVHAVLQAVDL